MFQFPMTVPPCISAFFRIAGRRKNNRAPNRIERIRYGSAGKIKSVPVIFKLRILTKNQIL